MSVDIYETLFGKNYVIGIKIRLLDIAFSASKPCKHKWCFSK